MYVLYVYKYSVYTLYLVFLQRLGWRHKSLNFTCDNYDEPLTAFINVCMQTRKLDQIRVHNRFVQDRFLESSFNYPWMHSSPFPKRMYTQWSFIERFIYFLLNKFFVMVKQMLKKKPSLLYPARVTDRLDVFWAIYRSPKQASLFFRGSRNTDTI